mgnify:CR=1 FL=1
MIGVMVPSSFAQTISQDNTVKLFVINENGKSSKNIHTKQPHLVDGEFSISNLEVIENDGERSVIAIGSSMMYKAFNGSCFDQFDSKPDVSYYNLAIPNSRPYIDMVHIPKIIKSEPEIVSCCECFYIVNLYPSIIIDFLFFSSCI